MAAQGDRLESVLGPGWETVRYSQIADRARELEKAADLELRVARYIDDMDETAGARGATPFSGAAPHLSHRPTAVSTAAIGTSAAVPRLATE